MKIITVENYSLLNNHISFTLAIKGKIFRTFFSVWRLCDLFRKPEFFWNRIFHQGCGRTWDYVIKPMNKFVTIRFRRREGKRSFFRFYFCTKIIKLIIRLETKAALYRLTYSIFTSVKIAVDFVHQDSIIK